MFGQSNSPSVAAVRAALEPLVDPVLAQTLAALGWVKDIVVEGSRLRVSVELPTAAWEGKAELERLVRARLTELAPKHTAELYFFSRNIGRANPRQFGGVAAVAAVAPGVLFPYARAVVSQLVSQGGFPQMLLPPVNFDALFARSLADAQQKALNS